MKSINHLIVSVLSKLKDLINIIPYNKFEQSIICLKIYLISALIFGCETNSLLSDSIKTSKNSLQLKECGNSSNEIKDCGINTTIDACNYTDIIAFADALLEQLNYRLANCPFRIWECNPGPCCLTTKEFSIGSNNYTVDNTNRMPFGFCLNTVSCAPFFCQIAGGTFHSVVDPKFMQAIITFLRNLAENNRPECTNSAGGKYLAEVYSIQIDKGIDSRDRCDETHSSDCHNRNWSLRVNYTCGSCTSQN